MGTKKKQVAKRPAMKKQDRKKIDPLSLFGPDFPEDYVKGFYQGMAHLSRNFVMLPVVEPQHGVDQQLKAYVELRLLAYTGYKLESYQELP